MFWAMNLLLGIAFFTYFESVFLKVFWLDEKRLGIHTHRYVFRKSITVWLNIMMIRTVTFSCTKPCISPTINMEMSEMATSQNAVCHQPDR